MAKKNSFLIRFFYVVFFLDIAAVLCLGILDTQNNLPVLKMLIFPLVLTAAILTGSLLISGLSGSRFAEILTQKAVLLIFLLLYFILLSVISVSSRAVPDNDHFELYKGALYVAGLAEESNWEYFARCDNNIVPMLLLSVIIRVNQFLGLPEPYILPVILNSFQVTAAMYCVFMLLSERKKGKYSFVLPWVGVGMTGFFLPVIGHTQSVYTDAMSFSFSIAAYYIWSRTDRTKERLHKFSLLFLSGILWGLGAAIKMTVLISFIAVLCFLTVSGKLKHRLKEFAFTGGVIVVVLAAFTGAARLQPSSELRDIYGLPGTYWVGIGISGNGGYTDNEEYSIGLRAIYGMKEKSEFSREYIKDNLKNFADVQHIVAKARYNFASGNMGSSDFMRQTEHRNFFFECISTSGKYFWRFSMVNASWFYSILIFLLAGIAAEWRRLKKGGEIDELHVVTVFTVIGIGIYLMIFEANNRQLYNHYSWFVIGAVLGLAAILQSFTGCGRLVSGQNNEKEKEKKL